MITAEYGAVGDREITERAPAPPALDPSSSLDPSPASASPALDPSPASASPALDPSPASASPAPAPDPDTELDAMKTVPTVRRIARRSSSTPTEEVPRMGEVAELADDVEGRVPTRPRVTIVPQDRGRDRTMGRAPVPRAPGSTQAQDPPPASTQAPAPVPRTPAPTASPPS